MATYPTDVSATISSTSYNLTNRKPDRNLSQSESFGVATFPSAIPGYSVSRLLSRRSTRVISITYTNILGGYKVALQNFYRARNGSFESFDFALSHINETGSIRVKFASPLSITQVLATDSENTSIYTINIQLEETFT